MQQGLDRDYAVLQSEVMADKIPQPRERLEKILEHTWIHLQEVCDKFDESETTYALDISVDLRKLLKDSKGCKSLLNQLGLKDRPFFDSSSKPFGMPMGQHSTLFCSPVGGTAPHCTPYLDSRPPGEPPRFVPFQEWWGQIVLTDGAGLTHSRSDMVEYVAEQAGGAHVDSKVNPEFGKFITDNPMNQTTRINSGPERPISGADFAVVRQVAHEVFRTYIEDYPNKPLRLPLGAVAAVSVPRMVHQSEMPPEFLGQILRVGRNEPCPCGGLRSDGSPKKWKKCHGDPVRGSTSS